MTDAILEQIVAARPELGVRRVERVRVDPETAWSKLREGELDVVTEVYLPNQADFFDEAAESAQLTHRTYGGAASGWFVPAYAVRPGGPAAGLTSVDQLRRYAGTFGRRLYDGERGWVTTKQNAERIEGFSLGLEQVTGSEVELIGALRRSYAARRPILLYLWPPHWAHAAFDLVMLDEPKPYSVDCFQGDRKACAMPTNDVWVAARTDVAERWPKLWRLLGGFEIGLDEMERMLLLREQRGTTEQSIARKWLATHAREVDAWLAR